ncbi:MAG: hypothetical protein HY905_19205 [Deltaproteobacteria bacterium]|nr:hypothetical protein [Deltaproteobacteria bacterium]
MTRWTLAVPVALLLAAALTNCSDRTHIELEPGGIGDPCETNDDCRSDIVCRTNGTCGPGGGAAEGDACTYTDNCDDGLACLWERDEEGVAHSTCRAAGTATDGEFCAETAQCERGLVCVPDGYGGRCRPASSSGDLGDTCESIEDCVAGLVCGRRSLCVRSTSDDGGPGYVLWPGVDCAQREEGVPTRFYFEIPRGALEAGHDFFRLPWPNDIRKTEAGKLDLSGFPHPAMPGVSVDVLDRFLRAAEQDLSGFATNGAVFFRSSNGIDWGTLDGGGESPTIYFVDLTPPAEPTERHGRIGFGWAASTGGGRYICQDWLGVRPPRGGPLLPGRTYAVVITAGVHDADGATMARDPDFEQMLRPTRPAGDDAVAGAWDAYAPFRAYLDHDGVDGGTILVATVFTTQDFPETLRGAKQVVDALPAPETTGVILCNDAAHSVCDDGLTGEDHIRGCFGEDPAFYEIQGRFRSPNFQEGSRPYLSPEDGGGFTFDAAGVPEQHGENDVCFSLTVPKGATMPADGFPVVVYLHGTGGSYRSFISNGVAGELTAVTLDDATTQNFAVLSFDAPQHGARRGGSSEDPEILFFNFVNPGAAYGNVLQGAIDGWQAARMLLATNWDAAASPTGSEVRFDPARMYWYGHSQGATHGVLSVAYDPSFAAAVMSGAGGSLIESLLAKTSPYNIAAALRMALADPNVSALHPALTIFQMYLEVADPVNYGKYVVWLPFTGNPGRHVLMTYGLGDTYTPKETLAAMATSFSLSIAEPLIEDIGLSTVTLPASANRWVESGAVTAVLTQHNPPAGEDGHFVSTSDETAKRRIEQFLGTAARDGTPTVVP